MPSAVTSRRMAGVAAAGPETGSWLRLILWFCSFIATRAEAARTRAAPGCWRSLANCNRILGSNSSICGVMFHVSAIGLPANSFQLSRGCHLDCDDPVLADHDTMERHSMPRFSSSSINICWWVLSVHVITI